MILVLKSDVTFWGQNFIGFDNYCDNEAQNCHTVCFTDGCRYSLLFVSSLLYIFQGKELHLDSSALSPLIFSPALVSLRLLLMTLHKTVAGSAEGHIEAWIFPFLNVLISANHSLRITSLVEKYDSVCQTVLPL